MIEDSITTIAAPATASGRAGIAVVRLSGPNSYALAAKITNADFPPRSLERVCFYDNDGEVIDSGLAVFFKGPKSYTGEDVVEMHCHGNPIIVDQIIKVILMYGGLLAEPGEFTKRAFLNGKINLFQAEVDKVETSIARTPTALLEPEPTTKISYLFKILQASQITR